MALLLKMLSFQHILLLIMNIEVGEQVLFNSKHTAFPGYFHNWPSITPLLKLGLDIFIIITLYIYIYIHYLKACFCF